MASSNLATVNISIDCGKGQLQVMFHSAHSALQQNPTIAEEAADEVALPGD